jgi:hypothetical protein
MTAPDTGAIQALVAKAFDELLHEPLVGMPREPAACANAAAGKAWLGGGED